MSDFAKTAIATLITFALVALAWVVATGPNGLPSTALPPPGALYDALYSAWVRGTLWPHIIFTAKGAAFGLLLGVAIGFVLASIVVMVPVLEYFVSPIVVGMQSVPKIAIAPLIVSYAGFGLESKVFTATMMAFFPVFVSLVRGLRSVDPLILDLYRAFSASRLHVMLHARLPASAPFLFASLKVAVLLSLIGAIVSEFIASSQGLGYIIKSRSQEFDVSIMFASIISLAIMGVLATAFIQVLQKRIVFWNRR